MAKPRIFISSTFYDLRQIREDLERSVRELGYEPVRNETGSIPFGREASPEAYAYKELELCDILVSIIGGRYGSESRENAGFSISQTELKMALDRGIQVFILIEKSVNAEFETYRMNKGNSTVKYNFVDNSKIYEFVESVHALPKNNPISTFEMSSDITDYLRMQWAGLFQRYLQEEKRNSELRVLDEMRSVSATLQELVKYLTEERKKGTDEAINSILMANHPAFRRFAEVTGTPYRIYFTNLEELGRWLAARGWEPMDDRIWDDPDRPEWSHKHNGTLSYSNSIFNDDKRLRLFTDGEWSDSWVQAEKPAQQPPTKPPSANSSFGQRASAARPAPRQPAPEPEADDDIPF